MPYARDDVVELIDHTLFKPEATHSQVREFAEEADELGACPVYVLLSLLPLPFGLGSTKPTVVCGFSSGAHHSDVEAIETARAVAQGADEADMVANLAWTVGNEFERVETDIHAVHEVMPRAALKAITESAALNDEQIVAVCGAAKAAGADFVKTSAGSHPSGGVPVHAVTLMKATVGGTMQVKASGGIHDGKFAVELLDAGVMRLGLSASAEVFDTL